MLRRKGVRAAVAISVAAAVPLLASIVNGFFAPGMLAVGAVAGLCVWFWRLLLP